MSKEAYLEKKRQKVKQVETQVAEEIIDEISLRQVQVLELLDEHPEAKDSYAVLVTRFHQKELKTKGINKTPYMMSDEEIDDQLTSPESITRAYRKLQENSGVQFASNSTQSERNRREDGFKEGMPKMK